MTRLITHGRWKPGLCFSIGWLLLLVFAALFADYFPLNRTPDLLHSNASPLTPGHPLGTDSQGLDVVAGLLYGARTTLLLSGTTALIAALLGTVLGVVAGYWGNTRLRFPAAWVVAVGAVATGHTLIVAPASDLPTGWWLLSMAGFGLLLASLLRSTGWQTTVALPLDALMSAAVIFLAAIPRLLLVVLVAATVSPGVGSLVLLLALTCWVPTARLVRAEVQRVRLLPYVEAAMVLGLPSRKIILHHILPNSLQVVRTTLPLSMAALIGLETTLSFLGVGLPPELPSWGRLLAAGRAAPTSWWLILFPVTALLFTALALRHLIPKQAGNTLQSSV